MITIDQLLESVDLDFEPRFITQDEEGEVWIWNTRPDKIANWCLKKGTPKPFRGRFISARLKLAEFDGKDWTECIYEVPQKKKTVRKIEKLKRPVKIGGTTFRQKINELVDAVNELKGAKNESKM